MRLIEEGADAILSIHLSSKLSGTYQSAWIARETLPDEVKKIPLELVDSQSASIGVRNTITWFREPFFKPNERMLALCQPFSLPILLM
jgi:fatty acid-binding protein DegV